MANKLNELRCAVAGGNVGRPECDIDKGPQIGLIFVPRDYEFALADTATTAAFHTALDAASIHDTYASRFMTAYAIQEITPTGDDVQEETLASGLIRRLRDGKIGYDFLFTEGYNAFRSYKAALDGRHAQYDVLEVTNQGDGTYGVWGTKVLDDDGANVLAGYRLERLNVGKYTPNVNTAGSRFTMSLGYADNNELDKNWAVMILDTNPIDSMTGLVTVNLMEVTSPTATTIHVKFKDAFGNDLIAGSTSFATALAQVGAVSVKNRKPGSADYGDEITVASAAATATGVTYTIAATGVDSDNPGSGELVGIALRAPSVLDGLTVPFTGYEGAEEVTVTLG